MVKIERMACMNKTIKRTTMVIISLIMIFSVVITAYAAGFPDGFHKVNGLGMETGKGGSYTSTITKECSRITMYGTSDGSAKLVSIHVYYNNFLVASITNARLNGVERTLNLHYPYTNGLPVGTYRIEVDTSDTVEGEVSTFFYQ